MSTLAALREPLARLAAQLPYLPRAVRLVWQAAPRLTAAWLALLAAQGALPVATVFLTRSLVDALVAAVGAGGGWSGFARPMTLAGALAAILLVQALLGAIQRWVRTAQSELVQDHVSALVQAKAAAVDLGYYESPIYFDQLHRVLWEVRHRPAALMENLGFLLQNGLTLLAMVAVLARFGFWIPLALLVSTLPALVVVVRYAVRQHAWRMRTTEEDRRANYYQWLLTMPDSAAEVRLFDLGDHFRGRFASIRERLRRERLELVRDQGRAELAGSGAAFAIAGLALAWMVWRTLQRQVTLGELAMFYQAFNQGQGLLRSLLDAVGQLYSNSLFLSNLFEFLELEPQVVDGPRPAAPLEVAREVRFRNVTFRYPGAERPVLEGFDLVVPAGQVVAVVGTNGAGKSTLLKLLCRFYDPEGGVVEVDGVDVRELPLASLRRAVTVLFQQPVAYNATVRENVSLGDLETAADEAGVREAVAAAGADDATMALPGGLDALLGRWFAGGHQLSVGEWQRVALARAFFRQAPLILLDEPTSAMDSWAENDWMERFRALAAGRTALVITHRFTTAMRADVIHVMVAGRIVESGSHAELIAGDGPYARSWRAQMHSAAPVHDP